MNRNTLRAVAGGLMVLSLVLAACGQAATPTPPTTPTSPTAPITPATPATPATPTTPAQEKPQQEAVKPTGEAPKYGGVLNIVQSGDITGWDDIVTRGATPGAVFRITNEAPWAGDWAKGPAGGYGTNEAFWHANPDIFDHKAGYAAESWKWTVDAAKDQGTIIYQVRQGVHWALNPKSEASRLVNGREMTVDDFIFSLKQTVTDTRAYVYRANPELRVAEITKTGPWEVSLKLPLAALITGISRFNNYGRIVPPEVVAKYGDMAKWQNSVGTGPFMITDYIPGSAAILVKNSNYWGKDPVGPGKGNPVPYIDGFRHLIIPDASTRLAALRTAKVDQMPGVDREDAEQFRRTTPQLLEVQGPASGGVTYIRSDRPPFNDVRVRQALFMATDFEGINQSLYGGLGQILSFPFEKVKGYEALYLGLDDPEMPASVKELYVYNPEKAKQLLKEAGYPNGFKTSVLITSTEVDFFSIYKDMWAKVGIELKLDVRDSGTKSAIVNRREHEALTTTGRGPVSIFYNLPSLTGTSATNASIVDDPVINEAMVKIREAAITDMNKSMGLMKELMKHVLFQSYAIGRPYVPDYVFWWPWVKNYSGENTIGYFVGDFWATWIWLDQDLKKSMGY
ncbi:MAG: ABC transporter substrate-binding protein [Chloroflexi bacterium]|nr:ABC transporter substrate-binding protein [Chloroflexota bacterium]